MTKPKSYHEPELTKEVELCMPDGKLNREAVGWSRQPLHNCNLTGNTFRKKRWNYWAAATEKCLFSATLTDLDYLGLAFIYFIDFETNFYHEFTIPRPFGRGCVLGNYVDDDVVFSDEKMNLSFLSNGNQTEIRVDCPEFKGEILNADLKVDQSPDHETLNVVIPWSDKRFQFTSKQNALPVEGSVTVGSRVYDLKGGFGCLDYGRGIWPFSSFWNWANAAGVSGNHTIGINLGAGWTDGTGMNENGICIDGKLSKISEDVIFEYNDRNFSYPWNIRTGTSEQVDITFEPFFRRAAKNKVLFIGSKMTQLFGRFTGTVKDDAGNTYSFENIMGWAEEHHARW